MINERFITYFKDTFFQDNPTEFEAFIGSIEQGIKRTIRIKPGKIDSVKHHLEKDGWILEPTNIERVFTMDRREDFDPLERRLGFSLDHLLGNFYIQELAAAHPVDILADQKIHEESYLILDMASSPGGKTTQLTEYFPNSFIIANEPTRERLPQLLQNLERVGCAHVGITLYPGQLYKNHREIFDRILLDAPCSGEGTLFKGTDAAKHWHLKNIKEIAKLQTKLLDAALHSLKVGGEIVYSTCSLNLLENEGVLEAMQEKYEDKIEIIYQKKFWPHIDKTGGFFVSKIIKKESLPVKEKGENTSEKITQTNKGLRIWKGSISPWKTEENIVLYEHEGKILAVKNDTIGSKIQDEVFLMRYGEQIGTISQGKFAPNNRSWKYLKTDHLPTYDIANEEELDLYLRGYIISFEAIDGYVLITYNQELLGLESVKSNEITNTFSHEWRRK